MSLSKIITKPQAEVLPASFNGGGRFIEKVKSEFYLQWKVGLKITENKNMPLDSALIYSEHEVIIAREIDGQIMFKKVPKDEVHNIALKMKLKM